MGEGGGYGGGGEEGGGGVAGGKVVEEERRRRWKEEWMMDPLRPGQKGCDCERIRSELEAWGKEFTVTRKNPL